MAETVQLALQALELGYGKGSNYRSVVQDLSLHLERGQIGCLLGASGCGKSTVLRAISGFEPLHSGSVHIAGQCVASQQRQLPPEQRRVGLMFQDYALFPHLDVAGNIGFGLKGQSRQARGERVGQLLEQLGLADMAGRYPHELSGGQQQRVALARALAPSPELLLLDEPFSNLDVDTRQRLVVELRDLLKAAGTTVMLVTHDQSEAFAMADRVGVMAHGRLLQWGTAPALYHQPVDPSVAAFIGRGALVSQAALGMAGAGRVLLRPEYLRLDQQGTVAARVADLRFVGPGHEALLQLADGSRVPLDLPLGSALPQVGETVQLDVSAAGLLAFA